MLSSFELATKIAEDQAKITKLDSLSMSYKDRIQFTNNSLTAELLNIMTAKQSNLCVAADVCTKAELLSLAESIGPHICILKLHIDIIEDFDFDLIAKLAAIAAKHQFMLFEDRKFADIGATVEKQYGGGIYKISSWAQLVNAHSVPGDGVIDGIKKIACTRKDRALILIGEMSSKGNLCTPEYRAATVAMANRHSDFVMGFISMNAISDNPGLLHMTPGVQFASKGDALGQQYRSPEDAVLGGSDIIIVGRGVIAPKDKLPSEAAIEYKEAGWNAYEQRIGLKSTSKLECTP